MDAFANLFSFLFPFLLEPASNSSKLPGSIEVLVFFEISQRSLLFLLLLKDGFIASHVLSKK